jgi:putative phosphoesterase
MRKHVVGLISDTHGLVRPEIARVFEGVSRILHAGDVGGGAVLRALEAIAPVDAVFGNVDDVHDPALARERVVTIDGVAIHVSHGHELGGPTPELVLSRYSGDIVMFGHTHRAVVFSYCAWGPTPTHEDAHAPAAGARRRSSRTHEYKKRLAVNPGAAGPRRFDIQPSVALLTIDRGTPSIEIISLTKCFSSSRASRSS